MLPSPVIAVWAALGTAGAAESDLPPVADCPAPTTLVEFQAAARAGERAFAYIDLPALTRARAEALATLPCLEERVTTEIAADFHRMMAMAAFTAGNESLVLAEFRAARRLKPGYEIPAAVAPDGHPLVTLYTAAAETPEQDRDLEAVIPPIGSTVAVDGAQGGLRLHGLSAIVQFFGEDDQLTATEYLLHSDPTPRYGPLPIELAHQKRRRRRLLAATGASALIAGGLYTRALVGEQQFLDTTVALPTPREAQATNNAFFWSSVGVSSVTVGLGVFTAVTW